MKNLCIAALAAVMAAFCLVHPASAQGVTRVCQQSVNSVTGANNCVDVDATHPLNVTGAGGGSVVVTGFPNNLTFHDCSGSVTAGGTAQIALSAQITLHGVTIANIDGTSGSGENLWISFTGTATANTAGSYPLVPLGTTSPPVTMGGSWTTPAGAGFNGNLSVVAATTGHKWSCSWW